MVKNGGPQVGILWVSFEMHWVVLDPAIFCLTENFLRTAYAALAALGVALEKVDEKPKLV